MKTKNDVNNFNNDNDIDNIDIDTNENNEKDEAKKNIYDTKDINNFVNVNTNNLVKENIDKIIFHKFGIKNIGKYLL